MIEKKISRKILKVNISKSYNEISIKNHKQIKHYSKMVNGFCLLLTYRLIRTRMEVDNVGPLLILFKSRRSLTDLWPTTPSFFRPMDILFVNLVGIKEVIEIQTQYCNDLMACQKKKKNALYVYSYWKEILFGSSGNNFNGFLVSHFRILVIGLSSFDYLFVYISVSLPQNAFIVIKSVFYYIQRLFVYISIE